MPEIYVGLGSNVGDTIANLREAVERLARHVSVEDVSSGYWTEPVGPREQPYFLNAVVRARTALGPREALSTLEAIEEAMGRQRSVPQGPRSIDLDLLLYDDLVCSEPGLSLPHPRMEERRFVLEPLAEVAPGVRPRPGGPTARELLDALPPAETVERLVLPDWPPALDG